jgi:hypothetical protein
MIKMGDELSGTIKRGKPAWDYLYIVLGFSLTIESTIVAMMTPIIFPCNILAFLAIAFLTVWAFIESEWLHDKLFKLQNRYENKYRPIEIIYSQPLRSLMRCRRILASDAILARGSAEAVGVRGRDIIVDRIVVVDGAGAVRP